MTRINSNVSSLIAQNTLARSNSQLQESLTRLSTGLRINTGKDDPAGLIASEALRADITSVTKAISNSQRANQLIATADSALGQVAGLLNDIRGLVVEAANSGVMSDEQIAANQLQIDSSLEAIDRIAQVTTFQGRKLLDGSLDFNTAYTAGGTSVRNLAVTQANLGSAGSVAVSVDITTAASQAQITNDSFVGTPAVAASGGTITFSDITTPAVQATGTLSLTNTTADIDIEAVAGEAADGAAGNDVIIDIVSGATTGAAYDAQTNTLTVTLAAGATVDDLVQAIEDTDEFTASLGSGTGTDPVDSGDIDQGPIAAGTLSGGVDAVSDDDVITIDAVNGGTAFNGTVSFATDSGVASGAVEVSVTNGNITITVNDGDTWDLADLADEIQTALGDDYTVALGTNDADGSYDASADAAPATTDLTGGTEDVYSALAADLVVKISGSKGAEVFNFAAGSTVTQVVNAINLLKDSTGVSASNNAGTLELDSTDYGSSAFVDVEVINEGTGGTFEANLSGTRDTGTDIVATVNGVQANGKGNTLSISTTSLALSLTVDDASTTDVSFNITGGGALFQIGPDIVSNQQARIGIGSVNTGKLGGVSGRLYELRSGGAKSLESDAAGAAAVVDEVLTAVTSLRGRLGAFQRTTLDTNIAGLNDTLSNLTDAQSSIRDADFAAESARLTRAQILVQSGTAVLQIANSSPQNVLALLRG